jgi:hypothetical protein
MQELLPHYLGYLLKGHARLSILRKAALFRFYLVRWVFCVPPRFPNFANWMPNTQERVFSSCDGVALLATRSMYRICTPSRNRIFARFGQFSLMDTRTRKIQDR